LTTLSVDTFLPLMPQALEPTMIASLKKLALVGLIAAATAGCAAVDTANKWGSDAWVTSKVKTNLCAERGASTCADINVETHGGVVQLSGFANNQAEINGAVETARKTPGVRSVRNDIRLKRR
jgi:osmotically-inducible protein OsmY